MMDKYHIVAFDYPFKRYEHAKKTNSTLVAFYYFVTWSMKYDGVDIFMRKQ